MSIVRCCPLDVIFEKQNWSFHLPRIKERDFITTQYWTIKQQFRFWTIPLSVFRSCHKVCALWNHLNLLHQGILLLFPQRQRGQSLYHRQISLQILSTPPSFHGLHLAWMAKNVNCMVKGAFFFLWQTFKVCRARSGNIGKIWMIKILLVWPN